MTGTNPIGSILSSSNVFKTSGGAQGQPESLADKLKKGNVFDVAASMNASQANAYNK